MSYILDALKKSESERLRRDAPGFADLPQPAQAAGTPRWGWLLGALLIVNAAVLLGLWLRPQAAAPRDTPAAIAAEPLTNAADKLPAAVPPVARAAVRASPPPAATAAPAAAAGRPIALERAPAAQPQAAARRDAPAPAAPESAAAASAAATTPTLMELRANGTLSLPDLHLDIHVYSSRAEERFVFVNMQKYREQERLAEGPLVSEIGPDGVILEYRDRTFLLPRE